MGLARNTNVLIGQFCPSYLLFVVIFINTCYIELHNFILWRPFWQRLFILGAAVKLNMTQLKKNGFTIFLYPLENISDVMEDTARVLSLVCFMSLSPEVIF